MITVKELIEKLQKVDQNAIVIKTSNNFELRCADVKVNDILETTGEFVNRKFQDSFDGETYNGKVFIRGEGNVKVVTLY